MRRRKEVGEKRGKREASILLTTSLSLLIKQKIIVITTQANGERISGEEREMLRGWKIRELSIAFATLF